MRGAALIDLDRSEEAERTFIDLADNADAEENMDDAARKCAALATFYRSQEDNQRAQETFEKCLEKFPSHALLQQWVSDFFVDTDQPEKAIDVWRKAVEITPEDMGLRGKLAELLYGQGHDDEAEQVVKEIVELFDTPQAWHMLASFYRKSGDPTAARQALEEAMERTRDVSPQLRFALADMLIEEGDLERAEKVAKSMEEPSYRHLLEAAILLARDQPEAALEKFDAGLRLWPNNAGARYLAARAARELGDRERAIAEYREAVRVGETETDAALRLAEMHYEAGRFKAALQFAERHIKKRPFVDPTAHIIAARSAIALGQYERAETQLRNLKAKNPRNHVAYVEFAALARKTKGAEAAVDVLTHSGLDFTDPANSEALRALASDYLALGQSQKAIDQVNAAVAAHADSAKLLDLQARVLLRLDREKEARQALQKALAAEDEFAPALETLGTIARGKGDLDAPSPSSSAPPSRAPALASTSI